MFVVQYISWSVQNTPHRLFDVQQVNCKYSPCFVAQQQEKSEIRALKGMKFAKHIYLW